ncbi:acyl-CoA carboxylase subunit epsilon [Streptomyces sp. PKU-EA00015]|uniref:acyl-CoA carboxylase subunit epsilon n=1 Tax=Streptomyces sp. PKU-EA00015 TaxID=2748326 RepID=UPI0015A2CFAB|nr:acyl-CoA carboxylase subunit epsilon [Streptomyces sp. PKU-EA00015]NWF27397.1 acyl-CoA carboxylase subunit epsilon [Streptomyces sp. PKU-EA00015]
MDSIEVLYGRPTPEELAAVVAVLRIRAAHAAAAGPATLRTGRSAWADRAAAIGVRPQALDRLTGLPRTAYGWPAG